MISVRRLFLPSTLLFLLYCRVAVHGQSSPEGDFISIDCGRPDCSNSKSYTRGITYICDDKFIDTGETYRFPDDIETEHSPTKYLRSFPNGTRNCFRIEPVRQNQKYLVRTSFMYNNYDGKDRLPGFRLYLGIHFWDKVYAGAYSNHSYFTIEVMFTSVSTSLSLCLVNTNEGTPFISAIDLRPIPNILYPEVNASQSLGLTRRVDFGGQNYVWYPNDNLDRLWLKESGNLSQWTTLETTSTVEIIDTSNRQDYQIPQVVLKAAVIPVNDGSNLEFNYSPRNDELDVPLSNCYATLYFAEVEQLNPEESRIFTVSVNNMVISDAIQPKYLQMTTFSSILHPKGDNIYFQISPLNGSTKLPLLNAMELYCAINMTRQSETEIGDVNAITEIKKVYKLRRNWMGDPCVPKELKWEGLTCIYEDIISPRITYLNLSSSRLTGAIPSCFGNLTQLQQLDLSNNTLTGKIPESLASLSQLKYLNLARNNLEGRIPDALLERSANHSLRLRIEGNPRLCTNPTSCLSGNNNVIQKNNKVKNHNAVIIIVASIGSVVLLLLVVLVVTWKLKRHNNGPSRQVQVNTRLQTTDLDIKLFTYNELVSITNNFAKEIGHGGFGLVYHGICNHGIQVAVKMLGSSSRQGEREFFAEVMDNMRMLGHNLVKLEKFDGSPFNTWRRDMLFLLELMGVEEVPSTGCPIVDKNQSLGFIQLFVETTNKWLKAANSLFKGLILHNIEKRIAEFYSKTETAKEVWDSLEKQYNENESMAKIRIVNKFLDYLFEENSSMLPQVKGLEYLHKCCTPSIVHRDVKTSNILLTKNMEARIADFGLSRIQVDGVSFVATRIVGTPGYLDPEYYTKGRLHEKSDVYSFGVVLMELITGKPAIFNTSNGSKNLVEWVHERFKYGASELIDKRLQDYDMKSICKAVETSIACCSFESLERPDITQVLSLLKECLELETTKDHYREQYSSNEFKQDSSSSVSIKVTPSSNSRFLIPTAR